MPTRRPRTTIGIDDISREPDEVMRMLISMKNDNRSWDMLAASLTTEHTKVSAPLVRKVALGLCKSPRVEAALGLREETITIPVSQYRKPRATPPRQRTRLTIDTDAATVTRYDYQRGNSSRREYLAELMDLAEGELPY